MEMHYLGLDATLFKQIAGLEFEGIERGRGGTDFTMPDVVGWVVADSARHDVTIGCWVVR